MKRFWLCLWGYVVAAALWITSVKKVWDRRGPGIQSAAEAKNPRIFFFFASLGSWQRDGVLNTQQPAPGPMTSLFLPISPSAMPRRQSLANLWPPGEQGGPVRNAGGGHCFIKCFGLASSHRKKSVSTPKFASYFFTDEIFVTRGKYNAWRRGIRARKNAGNVQFLRKKYRPR